MVSAEQLANGPLASLKATMAAAFEGPIPGNASKSPALAVLMLMALAFVASPEFDEEASDAGASPAELEGDSEPSPTVHIDAMLLKVAAPMPLTSVSAEQLANGPLASRCATMAAALLGPMPGSESSSVTEAVLMLTAAKAFDNNTKNNATVRRQWINMVTPWGFGAATGQCSVDQNLFF